MPNGICGKRVYLAESGRDLRLGVRLEHRGGLLAACLSAIIEVAETDKHVNHRRRGEWRAHVPESWLLVTILRSETQVKKKEGREETCDLHRRGRPGCSGGWQPYSDNAKD